MLVTGIEAQIRVSEPFNIGASLSPTASARSRRLSILDAQGLYLFDVPGRRLERATRIERAIVLV
jgi:hypothetical protein